MDNKKLEKLNTAINSEEGKEIVDFCQECIEDASISSKTTPEELRGMIKLLKSIKDIKNDFNRAINNK